MTFIITLENKEKNIKQTFWSVEEFYADIDSITACYDNLEITAKFDKNTKITIEVE